MSNENQKSSDKYSKLAGNTLIFAAVVLAQLPAPQRAERAS